MDSLKNKYSAYMQIFQNIKFPSAIVLIMNFFHFKSRPLQSFLNGHDEAGRHSLTTKVISFKVISVHCCPACEEDEYCPGFFGVHLIVFHVKIPLRHVQSEREKIFW